MKFLIILKVEIAALVTDEKLYIYKIVIRSPLEKFFD